MRKVLLFVLLAGLTLAAVGWSSAADTNASNGSGPPIAFASGDKLLLKDRTVPLSRTVLPAITGYVAAAAIPGPHESRVIYNAFEYVRDFDFEKAWSEYGLGPGDSIGGPSLRIVDTLSGEDRLFVDGAESVAWSDSDQIAYFKGDTPDLILASAFVGHIYVQQGVDGEPVAWTTGSSQYTVLAWAGSSLLFYDQQGDDSALMSSAGPGESHMLSDAGALLAVSPDGTKVAIVDYSSSAGSVQIKDVATGATLSEVTLTDAEAATSSEIEFIDANGDWFENRIAVTTDGGILVLRTDGTELVVERLIKVPSADYPMGLNHARFDSSGSQIVGWAPIPGRGGAADGRIYTYVACDVDGPACRRGPTLLDQTLRPATNPSRP